MNESVGWDSRKLSYLLYCPHNAPSGLALKPALNSSPSFQVGLIRGLPVGWSLWKASVDGSVLNSLQREDPPFRTKIPLFSCVTLIVSVIPLCLGKPWIKALYCEQHSNSLRDLNLLSMTLFWKIVLAPSSTLSPQSTLMLSTKIPPKGKYIEFIPARSHPRSQPRSGWGD